MQIVYSTQLPDNCYCDLMINEHAQQLGFLLLSPRQSHYLFLPMYFLLLLSKHNSYCASESGHFTFDVFDAIVLLIKMPVKKIKYHESHFQIERRYHYVFLHFSFVSEICQGDKSFKKQTMIKSWGKLDNANTLNFDISKANVCSNWLF